MGSAASVEKAPSAQTDNKHSSIEETAATIAAGIQQITGSLSNTGFAQGAIPNPGSSIAGGALVGGTFAVSAGLHEQLVNALDSSLSNGSDITGSFHGSKESYALKTIGKHASKINGQYNNLSASVEERISNIYALNKFLDDGFSKLYEIVKSSGTDVNNDHVRVIEEVQSSLSKELEKQLKALENVLKISIKPTRESLVELLNKNKSFTALAETLGVHYGDENASDRLALVFTNVSQLGLVSEQIKEALKTLHITLNDYKKITNISKLKNSLASVFKSINKDKKEHKLNDILKAMEVLENNQHWHSDIVKCVENNKNCSLKKITGSNDVHKCDNCDCEGGCDKCAECNDCAACMKMNQNVEGGDYTTSIGRVSRVGQKSTLNSRIQTYEKTLKQIFKSFISQVNLNFKDIQKNIESVSEQIGSEILYNDNLKSFIDIFEGFNDDLSNDKLFYAIIGLDNSTSSKELKNRFMDNLNMLIHSLDAIKGNKYLNDIHKILIHTKENIDTYSDTVTNIKKNENQKTGSSDIMWTDKLIDQSMPINTSKLIRETIVKLKFYGNIAMIKDNLHRMSKEHQIYKQDYNNLLGKSIGVKLTELNREYVENVDRINDKERGRGWLLEQYNISASENAKIPRGFVETVYKLQYESKVGLYKTVEAIDLYLMNFTEQLSGNIDAIKDLNKMLQQTEIISKWFNKKSGENLQELLSGITENTDNELTQFLSTQFGISVPLSPKSLIGIKAREALEQSKKTIDSIAVLKNIISMFIHIGDKFGNKSLSKEMYMSPNVIYKNLVKYIWVSAFTMGYGTGGGKVDAEIESSKKNKGAYEIEKGDVNSFFALNFTSLTSPLDVFNKHETEIRALITSEKAKKGSDVASLTKLEKSIKNDIFATDDKYFILTLKAITAKIITVIDSHNLIKRPANLANLISNPVRMVIGGAEDPAVINEAFELYIRLPLLVEFYKNVFNNGNEEYKKNQHANDDSDVIAYIPEVGSLWSGLIQCIFDESKYINSGIYSLDNMKRIISEINNIYKHYSKTDKNKLVRVVVLDLVAEINRRYGVLKRKDINEFYQIKKNFIRKLDDISVDNDTNYDILDETEEYEDSGPSGMYTETTFNKYSSETSTIITNDINIVNDFRNKIHKELFSNQAALDDLSKKSFSEKIKFYKHELTNTQSNESKFGLIIQAIDNSSNINSHNSDVNLMFNELIAYPLKNLDAIKRWAYNTIINYMQRYNATFPNNDLLKALGNFKDNEELRNKLVSGSAKSFNKVTLLNFVNEMTYDNKNLLDTKMLTPNKIIIDYSKLQQYVEKSIENVKYMISKFRNQISKVTMKKYEDRLFKIEDKLLIKMLKNENIDENSIYSVFNFDTMNNTMGNVGDIKLGAGSLFNDLYDSIMYKNDMSLINESSSSITNLLMKDVFRTYDQSSKSWKPHAPFNINNNLYNELDDKVVAGQSNALLLKFNSLVYQYLTVFYDPTNKKIYNNLFNEFVNKSQNSAIFNNNGIPDINIPSENLAGSFFKNDAILCESLAYMFKTLVSRTTNVQLPIKYHLVMSLNEVSPNFVQKYKAYLPVFINLFESIIKHGMSYKKILETTDKSIINETINTKLIQTGSRTIQSDVTGEVNILNGSFDDETTLANIKFVNTLNSIIDSSRSMINDAQTVLNEINVKPQYFEIKENFIKNTFNNTSKLPFMPMSLESMLLNKNITVDTVLPINNNNDYNVKFISGMNSIINNKSLDNNVNSFIWLKEEIKMYNNSSLSVNKIDINKINEYLDINNKFTITLANVLYYNRFISNDTSVSTIKEDPKGSEGKWIWHTYYSDPDNSLIECMSTIENASVSNSKYKITSEIVDKTSTMDYNLDRSNSRLLNIIDLNIIPINVHALMREIPLINLYNYAFTYDNIIKNEFGSYNESPSNNDEMLANLLIEPYYVDNKKVGDVDTYSVLGNTIAKSTQKLGKAKFLSDMIATAISEPNNDKLKLLKGNNKFTRNIIFMVNLQRVITYKIKNEVERINTKIVSDINILNSKITNYEGSEEYNDNEFEYLSI